METLVIPSELAGDLADAPVRKPLAEILPEWTEPVGYGIVEVIENRPTGKNKRWSSVHELVIQTKDGKLWRSEYTQGLTENQDECPFEYGPTWVAFKLVQAVPEYHVEYLTVDA